MIERSSKILAQRSKSVAAKLITTKELKDLGKLIDILAAETLAMTGKTSSGMSFNNLPQIPTDLNFNFRLVTLLSFVPYLMWPATHLLFDPLINYMFSLVVLYVTSVSSRPSTESAESVLDVHSGLRQ